MDNLREAKGTDTYTLKGVGEELWEPAFVYHGFRYVEVLNWPGEPHIYQFLGQVVSDGFNTTGSFSSSNKLLDQLYSNAWWSVLGNYKGMPVDCPQRDERQPWLGDRIAGSWGESYLFDNQRLYAKWLDDIQQAMSQEGQISDVSPNYYNYYTDNVTWPATYFLVAQMLYRQYGDAYAVRKHYPSMKKWMQYMESKYLKDGLMTRDKYGDWCMPPESPELIHAKDPARLTDGTLIATAYYIKLLQVMQEFATLLGNNADKTAFAALAEKMTGAFQSRFYDKEAKQYGNNTVTANLLPLAFNLVPEADKQAVFDAICRVIEVDNKGHIASGVVGTAWLMRTLSSYGRPDLAYKLATNTTYPSWGYMIKKGATTIWELWNGDTANPWMNSQNHVMLLGDLLSWYYEHLAGIKSDPSTPAFKQIIMRPDFPDGLTFVKSYYYSSYGLIVSEWMREGFKLTWNVVVPHNTEAFVYIPAPKGQVYEGDTKADRAKGVSFVRTEGDRSVFKVKSGSYVFKVSQ
jgi:alpha-L-rhamnosidase